MNTSRLKQLADQRQYHLLPVKTGYQLELHERVGDGNNQRIWRFKGLVIKVRKPKHADGSFTIRGKVAGMTIEKIYPLSFPNFEKVLLLDVYKLRQARIYYIRDKVGKGARMKSISSAEQRWLDLLHVAKEELQARYDLLAEPNEGEDIAPEIADDVAGENVDTPDTPEAVEEATAETPEATAKVETEEQPTEETKKVEETPVDTTADATEEEEGTETKDAV